MVESAGSPCTRYFIPGPLEAWTQKTKVAQKGKSSNKKAAATKKDKRCKIKSCKESQDRVAKKSNSSKRRLLE